MPTRKFSLSLLICLVCTACSEMGTFVEPPSPTPAALSAPASGSVVTTSVTQEQQYNRPINQAPDASLASIDPATGALHYGFYANEGQENAVHLIPDFSYAGYEGGGVALPTYTSIPVRITLSPTGGDQHARIQDALDNVASLSPDSRGIRGAVLLTAGLYEVSDQLNIPASGVVLRGEGQGSSGTILRATTTETNAIFIRAEGNGSGQNPTQAADDREVPITQTYVPVGSNSIEVTSTAGYAVGDLIAIHRVPNENWIGPNGVDMTEFGWTASQYDVSFQRTVVAIDENNLIFDIPMVDTIEAQYGGGEVYRADVSGRLEQVGIENLRLETLVYADVQRRDRAVDAISFEEVQNSWIRDVTVRYFSFGFEFNDGVHFVTAQNIAHLDPNFEVVGGNHYAFDIEGGGMNLFQRCYSESSRHAFTSGSRATGPNVFLDCIAVNGANDSGPHQRWATGTLFDNTSDDLIRVQNRQDAGTGHGWAGAQQMLWNGFYDAIVLQAPPAAMNWAVGNVGEVIEGSRDPTAPDGIFESHGLSVSPRSLYLQQLEDRLGEEAVSNVIIEAQSTGRIWSALQAWRGDGALDGDPNCFVGSDAGDTITGNTQSNTIIGGSGSDLIVAGDGDNLLVGDTTGASFSDCSIFTGVIDTSVFGLDANAPPGENFELIDWALQTPADLDGNDRADRATETDLAAGFEDEYFFTGDDGGMVFRSTIGGAKTSANTSYTRSELREMLRRGDTSISTSGVSENNWLLGYQPDPGVPVGGRNGVLRGTLAVNQVTSTGDRSQVGRVVIGQIHADNDEPVRLYYRKYPENERGFIYIGHEIRDSDDIWLTVVGSANPNRDNQPTDDTDPVDGIALDEIFSYEIINEGARIDVFIRRGDRDGEIIGHTFVDMVAENSGYDRADEWMYFKAGAYTQNNTGDLTDFDRVTFYRLENSHD